MKAILWLAAALFVAGLAAYLVWKLVMLALGLAVVAVLLFVGYALFRRVAGSVRRPRM